MVGSGDFVTAAVGRMDFVTRRLGVPRREAPEEKVLVVVFVEVLDCVDVAVGTTGGVAAIPPIAANSKSHLILYLFMYYMWPGLSEQFWRLKRRLL